MKRNKRKASLGRELVLNVVSRLLGKTGKGKEKEKKQGYNSHSLMPAGKEKEEGGELWCQDWIFVGSAPMGGGEEKRKLRGGGTREGRKNVHDIVTTFLLTLFYCPCPTRDPKNDFEIAHRHRQGLMEEYKNRGTGSGETV